MAQHGVIVRNLAAVESLGRVSVVCSDKTGTLTQSQMSVENIWIYDKDFRVTGKGYEPVGELFLSPMGLALVSKLAPQRVAAMMMGGWFLATAIGNKMAGVLASFWEAIPLVWIFVINGVSALAAALVIAAITPSIRRVMREHIGQQ